MARQLAAFSPLSRMEEIYAERLKRALRRANVAQHLFDEIVKEETAHRQFGGRVEYFWETTERFELWLFGTPIGTSGGLGIYPLFLPLNEVEVIAELKRAQSHDLGVQIGVYYKGGSPLGAPTEPVHVLKVDYLGIFTDWKKYLFGESDEPDYWSKYGSKLG